MSVIVVNKKAPTIRRSIKSELSTGQKLKTHGDLLRELSEWYGKSIEKFAEKINKSDKWVYMAFKDERIPKKNLINICRAFDIPETYFEGEFKLPLHYQNMDSNEPLSFKEPGDVFRKLLEIQEKSSTMQSQLLQINEQVLGILQEMKRLFTEHGPSSN